MAVITSSQHDEAPFGKELEDAAVGLMSLSGYYVSAGLVDRPYGDEEVLELDALAVRLASQAGGAIVHRVIVEAKSGTRWGYSEVLKLLGQKEYLGVGNALYAVSGWESERVDRVDSRFQRFGVHAVHVPGPLRNCASWTLWERLADRGLVSSAIPRSAARRRLTTWRSPPCGTRPGRCEQARRKPSAQLLPA